MKLLIIVTYAFILLALPCAGASAQLVDDPCPRPDTALSQTPTDLAAVQADIDRYSLCLERAQLIKRLNDLATENDAMLTGLGGSNPGMALNESLLAIPQVEKNEPDPEPEPVWEILEIFGSVGELQARLMKDAVVIQVRAGEMLPDGKTVDRIFPTEVVLSGNKGETALAWSP